MSDAPALRLIAEDEDGLQVISAAMQDAVLKAENLKFDRKRRRFTLEVNRYRWEAPKEKARVRSLLAIDSVLGARTRAVTKADPDMVMSVLNLSFASANEPPGGTLSILFSGDGELALDVEAMDVTLLDSVYEWSTRKAPDHEKRRR